MFKHAGDANEAFKQLPGAQDTDSFGRAQKQLKLTSGNDQPDFLHQHAAATTGGKAAFAAVLADSYSICNVLLAQGLVEERW